ncbi:MAG: hypothetical protein RLZZ54_767 [Cyanobacteriota bacterium]
MSLRFLPTAPFRTVRLPAGHSVLLNPALLPDACCIEVVEGMARVYCPCEETEGMTIAFLQPGDQLRPERLCSEGVCVEALTPLVFSSDAIPVAAEGFDPVNEWTLQLLRIRHLGRAEERLQALLGVLVTRMGKRSGAWCVLPFKLSHERIGELIGVTRVTTTKLFSRLRTDGQVIVSESEPILCFEPAFIAGSSIAF